MQFTTDSGKKTKVETYTQHVYQQLKDFIAIEMIQVDKQPSSEQNIFNLPINTIINISFS